MEHSATMLKLKACFTLDDAMDDAMCLFTKKLIQIRSILNKKIKGREARILKNERNIDYATRDFEL